MGPLSANRQGRGPSILTFVRRRGLSLQMCRGWPLSLEVSVSASLFFDGELSKHQAVKTFRWCKRCLREQKAS